MPVQMGIIKPVKQSYLDPMEAMRAGERERRADTLQQLSIERQRGLLGREKAEEARTEEKFTWEQKAQQLKERQGKLEDISLMNDEARNVYDSALRVYKDAKKRGMNELQANKAADEMYKRRMAPIVEMFPQLAQDAPEMFEQGEFQAGIEESMTHQQSINRELERMGMEEAKWKSQMAKQAGTQKLEKGAIELKQLKAEMKTGKKVAEKDRYKRVADEVKRLTASYQKQIDAAALDKLPSREEIEAEAIKNVESMESSAAGNVMKEHKAGINSVVRRDPKTGKLILTELK